MMAGSAMPDHTHSRLRPISSPQNQQVKDLRKAFSKAELTEDGHAPIESVRVIEEAIRSGLKIRAVFFSESGKARADRLLPQLGSHVQTLLLPDEVFASVVDTETPQGVAALVKLKAYDIEDLFRTPEPLLVVVSGVQDPGNLGTILRSAEAFDAAGVVLTEGTVSPLNAKSVRASAGSVFRLPVLQTKTRELLPILAAKGLRLLGTTSHKGTPLPQADCKGAIAICIGNEGAGLPKELVARVDANIMIPHSSKVESLNAGVAASIVLYEAARQRSGIHHGDTELTEKNG
jgi:TrmH family RNA methyltransferase